MGEELEADQAREQEHEHAELQDAENEPCGIDTGDRVEERALELNLDPLARHPLLSKSLPLPE